MAFAVALSTGVANQQQCPELDEDTRKVLSNIKVTDWKSQLIEKLREKIKGLDLKSISKRIGAEVEGDTIVVKLFGMPYKIAKDGSITTEFYKNPWIEILLLHYVNSTGGPEPKGEWVAFSELKSGMIKSSSFRRDCEQPLKELFDRDFKKTEQMLLRFGAKRQKMEGASFGWYLKALPKIPVLILYWQRQDDEPSQLKILFDKTADTFLDVESLIFLFEGLVNMIERGGFRE